MILTAQSIIYIYDNYSRLSLGKVDFYEALKKSPLAVQYEPLLKTYADREKHRIVEAITFCKAEDYIALTSAKLGTLFLIKTNLTSLIKDPILEPQIVGYIQWEYPPPKEFSVQLTMDPFSKYNCIISAQSSFLTNFKQPIKFKVSLNEEIQSISEKKEPTEMKNVLAEYLYSHCNKTRKCFTVCSQERISIYTVECNSKKVEYFGLRLLMTVQSTIAPKISQIQINYTCNMVLVRYQRRTVKVYAIDWGQEVLSQKVDFEVCFLYLSSFKKLYFRRTKEECGMMQLLMCTKITMTSLKIG